MAIPQSQSTALKKRKTESQPAPPPKRSKFTSTAKLPITSHRNTILSALATHRVLVLSGETGSGKSTQLPQYLIQAPWLSSSADSGKKKQQQQPSPRPNPKQHAQKSSDAPMIAVTQPRRVAAISLARRVATEMSCSPPGSRDGLVGYSVRFDEKVGPGTRVKFLTEGMLLNEMVHARDGEGKRQGGWARYGCVVIDEVHERSVNVDLILGFLRDALWKGDSGLRVVVMSATADIDAIANFFEGVERVERGLGDVDNEAKVKVAKMQIEGRQFPVTTHYLDVATDDVIDAAFQRIFLIHSQEALPGDILVFLTGQETIQGLQKLVEDFAKELPSNLPKVLVLPLFAALPQHQQQLIFERAPPFTRKVILATNIAETSITVPGVRFVIDTGKAKIKQFRSRLGLEALLIKPISKSSADQRKGRAGREAAGHCYRLYAAAAYQSLDADIKPEILRCDLSSAVLTMKARGVDDVVNFPFLTAPSIEAFRSSLLQLLNLDCLNEADGTISDVGRQVARLPLAPQLGRVLLEAAQPEKDCLAEVIDVVACFNVENIFVNVETEEGRERAAAARTQLFNRQGDHLTLLNAVRSYAEENTDRKRWCSDHMVSHRAMKNVMDVRRQLLAMCKHLRQAGITTRETVDEQTQERIIKCFLRGFRHNIARLCPDKSYKTFTGNQNITIHPSSVLFGRKVEAIVYNEFAYTNKAYARGVSVIQLSWLDELWSTGTQDLSQGE